jgi:hypothetical protein
VCGSLNNGTQKTGSGVSDQWPETKAPFSTSFQYAILLLCLLTMPLFPLRNMYFQYSLAAATSAMWEEDGTSGFAHSSKREEVELGEGGDERLVVLTALGCPAAPHPHRQDADRTPEQRGADFFTRKMEQLRQPRPFTGCRILPACTLLPL